ncbi:MAG: hypothetical protein KBB37_03765 [Bacteroidia bacterium]|nr:hypothetical protein [Bacteroidia bacterium]MBP7260382.1 hypothetical protein [Bacteroidia bacterium]MBP9180167.1 hypothetical protein [Bacteroidia bacterium]MBP9724272.1 hypothetical protein [Bacteroidia bacterium]
MKNKYSLVLLLAAFCCMGVQCKEDEPDKTEELAKLPPATTKGRNTFGCLINGKAFPQSSEGYHEKMVYYYDGELFVSYSTMFNSFDANEIITIRTNKIHSEGIFQIEPIAGEDQFSVNTGGNLYSCRYFPSHEDRNALITITRLDSINHIISGKFSFKAKTRQGDKEVSVEHGRFDFFYQ